MKNILIEKFSPHELLALDKFLRKQSNDMSLVKAHGFITAIVSFPELLMPSEWIPILVGELKILHDGIPVNLMLDKLITMYRQITASLRSEQMFEFVLSAEDPHLTLAQAPFQAVQEWCHGYCMALVWNEEEWLYAKEDFITKACATFFMLSEMINITPQHQHAGDWQDDKKVLVRNLPDLVKALYTYWLGEHRYVLAREIQSLRTQQCPCGSHKSYNNCCQIELAQASLH